MTRWPRGLSMQSPRRWAVAIATALPPDRPWPVLLVPGYGGGGGSPAELAGILRRFFRAG